jgi:hypothetical protein
VWTSPYLVLPVGAVCGLSVAVFLVALVPAADFTALALLAGLTLGTLMASGVHWLLFRGPLYPIDEEVRAITEVAAVYQQGYEIKYRQRLPSSKREKWLFYVFRNRQAWGYLDADFMAAKNWLYVENVYVDDRHGNKGLATALLLCAAKTTRCSIVTTSARTRQGVRFFAKTRGVLQQYGIDLRDKHP